MSARLAALAVATVAIAAVSGCGGGTSADQPATAPSTTTSSRSKPVPPPPPIARVPCPQGLAGCRSARGRIVYVERVDPDGDGDAHFVLASHQSITLPGISVIDVAADLRPHPLPGPGEQLAAAGQVQTGSYGQSQIHAVAVSTGD